MSDRSSKSSSFQTVNGGISLFLLTFIILCLVSFAALSIVSARADARLTEKYRQQTGGRAPHGKVPPADRVLLWSPE